MSNVSNINVVLSANSTNLRSQLQSAARDVEAFSAKAQAAGNETSKAGAIMAGIGKTGALAVGAALAYSVVQAARFEEQMRNVNSISKLSESQFQSLSQQVIDLSTETPQSAATLAAGLYDIASSGFQGADGMKVLRASAVAATAGMSDTATAAQGITAVLNAYGLQASDAADVSDVLFQTVNLGVITFGELSTQLGDVVGTAAAAKVNIGEVGAAVAAMTLSGISGAEATTSLNRVIQSLIQPSDQLALLFKKQGYESGNAALQALGLHGVMELIRKSTGGNVEALLQLFPEIRAARGAFALMANEGQNYNKTFDEIANKTNRAGATQEAFNEQMKALTNQFKLFVNEVNAGAIEIGEALLPYVKEGLDAVQSAVEALATVAVAAWDAMQPGIHDLGDTLDDIGTIIGNLVDDFGPLVEVILKIVGGAVIGGFNAVAAALKAVSGFLADNEGLVKAGAIAWVAYTAATWAAAAATSAAVAGRLVNGLAALIAKVQEGGGSWARFAAGATLFAASSQLVGKQSEFAGVGILGMTAAGAAMAGPWGAAAGFVAGLTTELTSGGESVDDYRAKFEKLGASLAKMSSGEALKTFFKNLGYEDALQLFTGNVKGVREEIAALAKTSPAAATSIVDSLAKMRTESGKLRFSANDIDYLRGVIEKGSKAHEEGVVAAKQHADAEEAASQRALIAAGEMSGFQASLDDSKKSADALKTALDSLFGTGLSAEEARIKWVQSVADLTKALQDNGPTLDINTEAGRKNRQAMVDSASAASDFIDKQFQLDHNVQGASDSLTTQVNTLVDTAQQFGLTSDQALTYTEDILGIPPEARTDIHNSAELAKYLTDLLIARYGDLAGIPPINTDVGVNDNATPILDIVIAKMNSIRAGAEGTITVKEQIIAGGGDPSRQYEQANGGVMRFYAQGGENHVAQVAPAGSWRVWAEPETGGEAYIPLATSKRGRSTAVLRDVAGRFGYGIHRMAEGGFLGGGTTLVASAGGVSVRTTINWNAPVYGDDGVKKAVEQMLNERDRTTEINLRRNRTGVS